MLKAKIFLIIWKAAVILSSMILINWLLAITQHWLLIVLLYASTGLLVRTAYGRMIPTRPDGNEINPNQSVQDFIAVEVIEFCNNYAFPLLWPIILLFVTLNPYRAEE